MVNFLDKFIGKRSDEDGRGRSLTARPEGTKHLAKAGLGRLPRANGTPNGRIPNASKVYGVAASVLFVFALYFLLFKGIVLTGILIMVLAGVLFGYAVFFMRFQS